MASRAVMLLRRAPALAGFGAAAARRAPRVAAVRAFASEPLSPTVGPTKQRTGLVGIEVVPNAREVLVSLYEKTLKDIQVRLAPAQGTWRRLDAAGRRRFRVVAGAPGRDREARDDACTPTSPLGRQGDPGQSSPCCGARVLISHSTTLNRLGVAPTQIIPEGVAYRNAVEAFTKYRLEVVRRLDNIQAIEDEIGCGQVEELIEIAKDELELIPEYASWKEWEEPYLKPSVDDMSDLAHDLGAMEKGSA